MGYDVHIRRVEKDTEDTIPISLDEWLTYVRSDGELRPLGDVQTLTTPDGHVISIKAPGMAEWVHPVTGNKFAFRHSGDGKISARYTSRELFAKMAQIAKALGAVVEGGEGERYDASGNCIPAQHIGIVACSAEGAALCYRTICVEGERFCGPHAHPEVSMHTHSLSEYMKCIYRNDWQGVGELMLASANKLAKVGADFLICPDNTIHQALPYIESRSPLPWLHIAEVVALEALGRRFHCLGLTGTRWLVESEVYPQKLTARGLKYVLPTPAEREEINRIIMDELVCGVFKPEAIAYFQQVITRMEKDEGCDAVILGCTEIPLIINKENSPLPVLDSTRLLAGVALRRAIHSAKAVAQDINDVI